MLPSNVQMPPLGTPSSWPRVCLPGMPRGDLNTGDRERGSVGSSQWRAGTLLCYEPLGSPPPPTLPSGCRGRLPTRRPGARRHHTCHLTPPSLSSTHKPGGPQKLDGDGALRSRVSPPCPPPRLLCGLFVPTASSLRPGAWHCRAPGGDLGPPPHPGLKDLCECSASGLDLSPGPLPRGRPSEGEADSVGGLAS